MTMPRSMMTKEIAAPVSVVFDTVAHIEHFAAALPHVVGTEFVTEQRKGVGTVFRETRRWGSREMTTELSVTEYEADRKVRLVAESHGTVWDTLFEVEPHGSGTRLVVTSDARSEALGPKIRNWLFKGMMAKAVSRDLDLVKAHCEKRHRDEA